MKIEKRNAPLKEEYVQLVLQRPNRTNHSAVILQELCIGRAPIPMKMNPPNSSDETFAKIQEKEYGTNPLAQHLTRAHAGIQMFEAGQVSSISELVDKLEINISNLFKTLKRVNLSPQIQTMIMEDREPESMTLAKLRRGVQIYVNFYNTQRYHSVLAWRAPEAVYNQTCNRQSTVYSKSRSLRLFS